MLAIWTFYVSAMRMVAPSKEAAANVVAGNPEWMWDYAIRPLLAAMRFRSLRNPAKEIAENLVSGIERTSFKHEVEFYREMVVLAEKGEDFSPRRLPAELTLRFFEAQNRDSPA